uniref:Uncharacterized protein n=1 Tax=Anguilla anguilla TaxID=7936 RepID=A0A0E9WUL1_ANGAN
MCKLRFTGFCVMMLCIKNGNDEKGYLTMYSLLMLTQELCLHLIYTYIQYANVFMYLFFLFTLVM